MRVEAAFQLTAAEFRRASRAAPVIRRMLIGGLVLFVFGLLELALGQPQYWFLAAGAGVPLLMEFAVRLSVRKAAGQFAAPWTVTITDRTFRLTTAVSDAEVNWNVYREVLSRSGFWLLQQQAGGSAFVPQRAFSPAQTAELSAFFAGRLPPKKRPWYRMPG